MEPKHEKTVPGKHRDVRRTILPVLNGDVAGFPGIQVKAALVHHSTTDFEMGCHHHPRGYDEIYVLLEGGIEWRLYEVANPSNRTVFSSLPGERVTIPSGWAHLALVKAGSIFVGISSKPYPVDDPARVDFRVQRSTFDW